MLKRTKAIFLSSCCLLCLSIWRVLDIFSLAGFKACQLPVWLLSRERVLAREGLLAQLSCLHHQVVIYFSKALFKIHSGLQNAFQTASLTLLPQQLYLKKEKSLAMFTLKDQEVYSIQVGWTWVTQKPWFNTNKPTIKTVTTACAATYPYLISAFSAGSFFTSSLWALPCNHIWWWVHPSADRMAMDQPWEPHAWPWENTQTHLLRAGIGCQLCLLHVGGTVSKISKSLE